jgi:hypothetical protein
VVHGDVELPQIAISEKLVIYEVELSSSMSEAVAVALSREVHPSARQRCIDRFDILGMTKFVSLEVQVALSTESVYEEPVVSWEFLGGSPDHLVQGQSTIDNWREGRKVRHEVV